jgi:NAD(P)H-dependent FMN reductase
MSRPRIAIIIGSTRDNRFGIKPARWVFDAASKRNDMEVELVDLKDFPLPFFNEVASNAWAPTQDETGKRWQKKVAAFDGYIFVTAEYNRSITAALKNALDFAYPEWNRKAAAFVGYGSVGAARAVEHLRNIAVELQMAPTRTGVHIQGADFMAAWQQGKELTEFEHLQPNLQTMLDELSWWAATLKAGREKAEQLQAAE